MRNWTQRLAIACVTAGMIVSSRAATLTTETFDSGMNGWLDRDTGEMVVSADGFGNPTNSLKGAFSASLLAETDAYRATNTSSSGAFTGDYNSLGSNLAYRFDFYSEQLNPSTLLLRFSGGGNTFFQSIALGAVATWNTYTISLTWGSWIGVSQAAFVAALNNVSWVDVQVTRNNTGAQNYYLDNFQLLDQGSGGNNGGGSAVPEPSTLATTVGGLLLVRHLVAVRRRNMRRAQQSVEFAAAG